MSNHEHKSCEHKLVYCSKCDIVYCEHCKKEWGNCGNPITIDIPSPNEIFCGVADSTTANGVIKEVLNIMHNNDKR